MSRRPVRSQRLLDLLQILRRHRYPVAGHVLAGELGISLRTLYRDIATLRQQGAHRGRRRRQALLREWRERESIAAQ